MLMKFDHLSNLRYIIPKSFKESINMIPGYHF